MEYSKKSILFVMLLGNTYGFVWLNNPLRQITFGRALQASVAEVVTTNLFDQSSLLQQIISDSSEEHKFLGFYVLLSAYFGYNFWNNMASENKLSNVPVYINSKRMIKQIVLVLFLILGKDVNNVI
jgi:hypothetical protein